MVKLFFLNDRSSKYKFLIYITVGAFLVLLLLQSLELITHLLSYFNTCPTNEPIDVVYTWVNGSDPIFLVELDKYLHRNFERNDGLSQRFDDKYELKFSLRSLEKFAPWVNHVYIVTNGQIPYWLNLDYEKVTLITHEQIFLDYEDLPSFSSPAIESHLHRIPGLSEKFLYFNDDIFLGEHMYLEDFISANKGYRLYMAWPLPMCNEDCPWMYVADNQCDKACNNPQCQFDGGDCDHSVTPQFLLTSNIELEQSNLETFGRQPTNYSKLLSILFKFTNNSSYIKRKYTSGKANLNFHNGRFERISKSNKTSDISEVVDKFNEKLILNDKIIRKRYKRRQHSLRVGKKLHANSSIFIKSNDVNKTEDAYSESLQYSNRLFNLKYGFMTRFVPCHSPIMIDKTIMNRMQRKFSKEFISTSKNRIRKSNDLQYSFTYYYYLIHEKKERSVGEIFDDFDTDESGTWSDREIRTLLAKVYRLPMSYSTVDHFETMLLNCSEDRFYRHVTTPEFERYVDSRLPTISKELVTNCIPLGDILKSNFGQSKRYKYEIVKNAETKYVSFKMLNSNVTDMAGHLDEVRGEPRKFICLNDNLDEAKKSENELIKSVLYDFYLSLFPKPSKFELSYEFRNRFLYMKQLKDWKVSECL